MKNVLRLVVYLILAFILFIAYARWFEWRNLFFPGKDIQNHPDYINLEYEDIYFRTDDGIMLNGWFIPAEGEARGTIIFCHGNAGNIGNRLDIIKMLHDLGMNVFIFDYRGYGKSKGIPTERGTYLDAMAAYDHIYRRDDVEKGSIIVYGKSLGGVVASDLAKNRDVKLVVSDSAFTSTRDMSRAIYPYLPAGFLISMRYDAASKFSKVNAPKLFIHSRDDEIVPFHLGEKLFNAAKEPKEFLPINGGHNEAIYEDHGKVAARLDEFFKKHGM